MVDYGVQVHWTDLGEPELFVADRHVSRHRPGRERYPRTPTMRTWPISTTCSGTDRSTGGTNSPTPERRRLLLSRSGSAGIQRFGTAIWSGDTGSRMEVLVAHLHAQAHMSCSGIDYFGVDVGGFRREVVLAGHLDELYTQWFANSAWFDVPLRPHVDNSPFYENAGRGDPGQPAAVPGRALRGRAPAQQPGESADPVSADSLLLLAGPPRRPDRHPPLPATGHRVLRTRNCAASPTRSWSGRASWWPWSPGTGNTPGGSTCPAAPGTTSTAGNATSAPVNGSPSFRNIGTGLFRLPAFARAGAIIPMMYVDADTLDSAGHRRDGSRFEDLILRVFDDSWRASSFTVFEDDGEPRGTRRPGRSGSRCDETASRSSSPWTAQAASRPGGRAPLIVEVVSAVAISAVTVNGAALQQLPDASRSQRGWTTVDTRTVRACVPDADVTQQQPSPSTSRSGPGHRLPAAGVRSGLHRLGRRRLRPVLPTGPNDLADPSQS